MDAAIAAVVISVGCGVIFGTIAYLLVQRDNQRQLDNTKLENLIKETAKLVLDEKDKTAALVLTENRATAKLVLDEKDKLAAQLKTEYKELEDKFTDFRIMIAREYATTTLVEKIMLQVTAPLVKKLDEIEELLNGKVDRREFERHEQLQKLNNQQ